MSEGADRPDERRYARLLTQLDCMLSENGVPIDAAARAVDISAAGFRAVTRAPLKQGQEVDFELAFESGERIRGSGSVAWSAQDAFQFDCFSSGIKITSISWGDADKLRGSLYRPGYDFVGIAKKMFWAVYILIVVVGAQNLLFHQATARVMLWKLVPVAIAAAALGASLFALLG